MLKNKKKNDLISFGLEGCPRPRESANFRQSRDVPNHLRLSAWMPPTTGKLPRTFTRFTFFYFLPYLNKVQGAPTPVIRTVAKTGWRAWIMWHVDDLWVFKRTREQYSKPKSTSLTPISTSSLVIRKKASYWWHFGYRSQELYTHKTPSKMPVSGFF